MPIKEEIKIFFSWQSSIDINSNANFIRHALKKAKDEIEKNNNNILLTLDEATRDMPGSPNIAEAIKNKISLSQIVISDLTIIDGKEERLSFPNPNVMFELGYAVAEIGWNRIIVLMNKKYGHKAEKLPFDVNGQRVSPLTLMIILKG
ncbi:TIR domain-containing protein [Candidatus Pantoea bituminis]|uniref:TIR domain-containing protein n=1 Tax=Candidatus Pantoea bituminis TaxID=2831036 RepID=UPI001C06072B|nr:TIR domain-containing protein [Pantoea bituminis]